MEYGGPGTTAEVFTGGNALAVVRPANAKTTNNGLYSPTAFLASAEKLFADKKVHYVFSILNEKDIDASPNIQVVYGFGAIDKYKSAVGYTGLKSVNIFRDVVENNENYENETILTKTIPELRKSTKFIPIYKYLRAVGITSHETFNQNSLGLNIELLKQNDFCAYKSFSDEDKRKNLQQAIECYKDSVWKAFALIPYLTIQDDEVEPLREFISEHFNDLLIVKSKYSTWFKKLICFYDWRKYGW